MCGREPWSSGYARRLAFKRSLHRFSDGHFPLDLLQNCVVCLKTPKINEKEPGNDPFFIKKDKYVRNYWRVLKVSVPTDTDKWVTPPTISYSISRFGEISQLWQNCKGIRLYSLWLFSIWLHFEPYYGNFIIGISPILIVFKAKYWTLTCHLVTLISLMFWAAKRSNSFCTVSNTKNIGAHLPGVYTYFTASLLLAKVLQKSV